LVDQFRIDIPLFPFADLVLDFFPGGFKLLFALGVFNAVFFGPFFGKFQFPLAADRRVDVRGIPSLIRTCFL